ncbi:MAG: hypothetical protein ABI740_09645 [Alphaproteobacteria bacterium]
MTAGFCLGGCATSGAPAGQAGATKAWRQILQVENRFVVFINEPGATRQGDLVTFRLAYVYAPGEVRFNEQVVGWQEYSAMTINCATHETKAGPRVRYAPDGKVMLSDDDQEFGPINADTAADAAARVRCTPTSEPAAVRIPDGGKWMDAARKRLAATPATPATQ